MTWPVINETTNTRTHMSASALVAKSKELFILGDQMKLKATMIEENRRIHDMLYRLMTDRNTLRRRKFVANIKTVIETRFRAELENRDDPLFRKTVDEFFYNAGRTDRCGNILQMLVIYTGIMFDERIKNYLCTTVPDPDTDDPDLSRVDRVAFSIFQQLCLAPSMENLLDGTSLTVPSFCEQLNGWYSSLLPNDPVLEQKAAAGRRNQRSLTFKTASADTFLAQELVIHEWEKPKETTETKE